MPQHSNPIPAGTKKKRKSSRRVEYIAITCEVCGVVREYTPGEVRRRGAIRFCSLSCAGIANHKPEAHVTVACANCGKEFVKDSHRLKSENYCSRECVSASRRVEGAKWRDPEQIKTYMRDYVSRNRDKHNARSRDWNKRNSEKKSATRRAYRAGGSPKDFTPEDWQLMKSSYGNQCLACKRTDVVLSVDHIVPISKGGAHVWENIQPLCQKCNRAKGTNDTDYRQVIVRREQQA